MSSLIKNISITPAVLLQDFRMVDLPAPATHADVFWYITSVIGYTKRITANDLIGYWIKPDKERYGKFYTTKAALSFIVEHSKGTIKEAEARKELGYFLCSVDSDKYYVKNGTFNRANWLKNNTWTLTENSVPDKTEDIWYFSECVGVFKGRYLKFDKYFGHSFGGNHGSIDATHWMPYKDIKPDYPWIYIHSEDGIVTEKDE